MVGNSNWPHDYPQPHGQQGLNPTPQGPWSNAIIVVLVVAGLVVFLCIAVYIRTRRSPYYGDSETRSEERRNEEMANEGDVASMIDAGKYYERGMESADGTVEGRDYAKALGWFQKAVDKEGNAEAMDHIGDIYLHGGSGVPQDYAKAREWYEKAAAKEDTVAMGSLAGMYLNGQGVEKSTGMYWQWTERADTANSVAQYRNNLSKSEKAANAGDMNAMNDTGSLYAQGVGSQHGVVIPKDRAKARE